MSNTNQTSEGTDKNRDEEIEVRIAAKVREDSQDPAQLTSVDSLGPLATTDQEEILEIELNLAEMFKDERYNDIKSVVASTGVVYLYSSTYITKNYAEILVRAATNDPVAAIAATVREESRIYPRPTKIELFKERVFNIDPDELETHIASVLEHQKFNDIKLIHASTGAHYLYSNLHLNEDYAKSLVEWEEVEQYENP